MNKNKVEIKNNGKLVIITLEGGNKEVRCGVNWDQYRWLEGKLLTLADAMIADQQQREAFKNLLKRSVHDWVDDVESACGYKDYEREQLNGLPTR